MTLRQLAEKTEKSVGDIVGWAMRARPAAGKPKKASAAAAPAPARATKPAATSSSGGKPGFDVRKPSGRVQYDLAVLDVVASAGDPASAQEIRAKVGGTPAQARAALNRLIGEKQLKYQGRARATRYFVNS